MTNKRREYTQEFKLEAISLVIDYKRKIAEVAESLERDWCIYFRQLGMQVSVRATRHYPNYWFGAN